MSTVVASPRPDFGALSRQASHHGASLGMSAAVDAIAQSGSHHARVTVSNSTPASTGLFCLVGRFG